MKPLSLEARKILAIQEVFYLYDGTMRADLRDMLFWECLAQGADLQREEYEYLTARTAAHNEKKQQVH